MSFSLFSLNQTLLNTLSKIDFHTPTPIQKEVIPLIMAKKDILAQAQTGSGKTAAFALPILNALLLEEETFKKPKIKALLLTPTRELTLQVAEVFKKLSQDFSKKPKVVAVIGGQSIGEQLLDVQKGCDILVATSGRLLDIINKKQINLSTIQFFVLDEADKMLDLNFAEELDAILECLPKQRQNLLFSATIAPKIDAIVSKITNLAVKVTIQSDESVVQTLQQRVFLVNKAYKSALLRELISSENLEQILIFMANKRSCDNIANKFRKYGFNAESFHGDLTQEERIFTLNEFKNKKTNILFATDIAARGLDIDTINCVVNFDLPRSAADYIHRIGRTARAGKNGLALTLLSAEELEHFKLIEKRYKLNILKEQLDGFEFTQIFEPKLKGEAPIKGKRKSKKDKLREKELK
ncbi:MAG: DEAD/DEAH box helicase [Arcobacteraceae bacterium]